MKLIFYTEAAEVLGVKLDTIKQAIDREVLTKAGRQGRKMCLVKEQVLLFAGINTRTGNKKRLSKEVLSPDELRLWKQYAQQAAQIQGQVPPPQREDIRAIVQAEVSEQTEQLEEAFASFLLQMGMQFKELRHSLRETGTRQEREVPQGFPLLTAR